MGTSSIYLLPQLPKKGTENINHSKNARDSPPSFQPSGKFRHEILLPFKQTFQDDKSTTQRGQQSILLSLNSLHWKELGSSQIFGGSWGFLVNGYSAFTNKGLQILLSGRAWPNTKKRRASWIQQTFFFALFSARIPFAEPADFS